MVRVELVYVPESGSSTHLKLELNDGTTVGEAIRQSNIHAISSETENLTYGIYGKLVSEETLLKDGDRIEFYRPLTIDPKDKRRKVARAKSKMKSRKN